MVTLTAAKPCPGESAAAAMQRRNTPMCASQTACMHIMRSKHGCQAHEDLSLLHGWHCHASLTHASEALQ